MKHFAIALAAAAATIAVAASPVVAQPYRYQDGYQTQRDNGRGAGGWERGRHSEDRAAAHLTSGYVDGLFWKLDNAVNEGRLAPGRARQLKRELREVQELGYPVETGRATRWERQRLAQTVARIDQALQERGRFGGDRERW